jgi:uncharacterized protein (DUF433 family)
MLIDKKAENLNIDFTRYIEKRRFGDRPHIRGRRLPIWVIGSAVRDNEGIGIPELMYNYDLTEAQAIAALFYYVLHEEEIECQEAAIHEEYRQFYETDGESQ